jgi:hypothetical protein
LQVLLRPLALVTDEYLAGDDITDLHTLWPTAAAENMRTPEA